MAGSPPPEGNGTAPGPAGLLCGTLVVAVTGSPAALSMPQYVLLMRQSLAGTVRVMMTRGARRFVRPYTMRLFAGDAVYTDTYQVEPGVTVPHIDLTADADLMLVMPATANLLGKAAHGICDDLVSTAVVACPAPVVLVPAMNSTMWRSRAVTRNVALARELGYHVIEPGVGLQLADLREAAGVMPPLEQILGELVAVLDAHRAADPGARAEPGREPARTGTSPPAQPAAPAPGRAAR